MRTLPPSTTWRRPKPPAASPSTTGGTSFAPPPPSTGGLSVSANSNIPLQSSIRDRLKKRAGGRFGYALGHGNHYCHPLLPLGSVRSRVVAGPAPAPPPAPAP